MSATSGRSWCTTSTSGTTRPSWRSSSSSGSGSASPPTRWPRLATAATAWLPPVAGGCCASPVREDGAGMRVIESFRSGSCTLACHLTVPSGSEPGRRPAAILCHGFPIGPIDARRSAGTFPQLVDRIAHDLGYVAMSINFRGTGKSTGDFSLQGWVDDLRSSDRLRVRRDRGNRGRADRHQHGRFDRHLRRCRRPAGLCCSAAQPTGRLRRLGGQPSPLPRARPRDRGDQHARLSQPRSTSGAGRSVASGRPTRPVGSRRARCW